MKSHKILAECIPLDHKSPDKQHFALYARQIASLEFGIKLVNKNCRNGSVITHFETDLVGDELEDMIKDVSAAICQMNETVNECSFC